MSALRALAVPDTPAEERFDRVTRLARRLFRVPIALVSLVDCDRQWFKSAAGLDASETPRDVSFCGHAILDADTTFVVEDAARDPRFADNPLVVGEPRVCFYAGRPIKAPSGHVVGTLCLIDHEPRTIDADELELLDDLAAMVEGELAAIDLATLDELTGITNRRGFEMLGGHALAMCRRMSVGALMAYVDLDDFKQINDAHGHHVGDAVLREMGTILLDTFRTSDVVCRIGGDEFAVLLTGADLSHCDRIVERLDTRVARSNAGLNADRQLAYSIGFARFDPVAHANLGDLLATADAAMYDAKRARKRPA